MAERGEPRGSARSGGSGPDDGDAHAAKLTQSPLVHLEQEASSRIGRPRARTRGRERAKRTLTGRFTVY